MAEKTICLNCGNMLKDHWLVCKFCHQARWKRIVPYYAWGAVFLVVSSWSITSKVIPPPDPDNLITLFLPGLAVIFVIIGVVMLMMAVFATLRGLTVRKVTAPPKAESIPDWRKTATVPPVVPGVSSLGTPAVRPSIPAAAFINQPAAPNLGPKVQTIHCQKCKQQNAPTAKKCKKCGTDLLPGAGIGTRLGIFVLTTILAVVCFGIAVGIFLIKPDLDGKDLVHIIELISFGSMCLVGGIYLALRKVPFHERYATRAKRHVSLNPWQAISDYGAAINLAPQTMLYIFERAKLYKKVGMTMESRTDCNHALEIINTKMAKSKAPDLELKKQRAEIYQCMGMEDEYAMEMLQFTIEKEKTFKTKRGEIAMGVDEGFKKGIDDVKRDELQKLRTEIMKNHRYGIVGQCKKCRAVVNLDTRLECSNNPKHRNITNINPTIRNT